jgi:DNA-binding XRE family transcriptional regulator
MRPTPATISRLPELRRAFEDGKGLPLIALAVYAQTSTSTILKMERYHHHPRLAIQQRIAAVLGVTVDDLWGLPDKPLIHPNGQPTDTPEDSHDQTEAAGFDQPAPSGESRP